MTTLDSSSAAESSMDDISNDHSHHLGLQNLNRKRNFSGNGKNSRRGGIGGGEQNGDEEEAEEGDVEVWTTLSKSFRQVQSVLDQNRVLIQQVNENHQSKIPDNLAKNVALIREINGNISRVVSLYSDLSANFSNIFHNRRENVDPENNDATNNGQSMKA